MPELLSPAGNDEKMRAAFLYGADAVYLGYKEFGMRAAADNFTLEELNAAVEYAHGIGKKIYLTMNTIPLEDELSAMGEFLDALSKCAYRPDGYIVTDFGVFDEIKRHIPDAEMHVSTQAGCVSSRTCECWYRLGAKRVVLARELSLEQIKEIRRKTPPDLELEAFIHGSMCVSFSGRCLLSGQLAGRSADRGMCTQPCRWNYTLLEEKRPDEPIPVEQDEKGTFIMSSKDMCTLERIPELIESGISSFKIEGRMKSAYYVAVVTNAYRAAIDGYEKYGTDYVLDKKWTDELESVSHREYCTGYYFDDPRKNPQLCTRLGYVREKSYLAVAASYDEKLGAAEFIQKNKLCKGDGVELISPGRTGRGFTVDNIYQSVTDGALADETDSVPHPFMRFYLKTPFPVKAGDILRGAK